MITREKSTRTPATGAPLRPIGAEVAISRSAVVNAGTNSQCMAAARSSADAFLDHERAKSELKALMPEDAKEAIGHGVRAKRPWPLA